MTLGVPAYRGAAYIAESLASIQAQTHHDLQVLISLDGPDPATEEACRPFLDDPRFRLTVRPERLGWVGNLNWLVDQAATPFWCYQQQDDVLDPAYLETLVRRRAGSTRGRGRLLRHADLRHPRAAGHRSRRWAAAPRGASSRCSTTTTRRWRCAGCAGWGAPGRRPAPLQRGRRLRLGHGVAVLDGARRRAGPGARDALPQAVPRRQRAHPLGALARREAGVRAWVVHCAEMLDEAMLCEATVDERRLLYDATLHRLTTARRAPGVPPRVGPGRRRGAGSLLRRLLRRSCAPRPPATSPSCSAPTGSGSAATRRWRRACRSRRPEAYAAVLR